MELLRDTEARGFANSTRHGELVVRLKGPYDIAANRANPNDGTEPYELTTPTGGTVTSSARSARLRPSPPALRRPQDHARGRQEAPPRHRRQETDGSIRLTLAA